MNEQFPLGSAAVSPAPGGRDARAPNRRRLLVVASVAAAILICYMARGPLLRGAASLLISEDPPENADYVLPLGGAREFAEAARLCRSGQAAGVLLIPPRPEFAQTLDVVATDEELMRRELTRAGTADTTTTAVLSPTNSDWKRFRQLGAWLADHPDARVRIVCGRFQSTRCRHLLRVVLSKGAVGRVRLQALARPEYDQTNWWTRKEGVGDFCNSSVSYAYILLCGEDKEKPQWNPDQYEKSLR